MLLNTLKVICFIFSTLIVLFLIASSYFYLTKTPSNNRQWEVGQQQLQRISIDSDSGLVNIKDLRDFDWLSETTQENYRDETFALGDIESIDVGVSHFSANESIAHVFIIFVVKGREDIGLSVEARRSVGEDYTITGGLTFSYDLAYFITSKRDLLSIREQRGERVYLFPTTATPLLSQQLFQQLAERVNQLAETPEFYHILFKNCATQVVSEVEKITKLSFPFYEKTFAPGFSGKVLFDMQLIKTEASNFSQVKEDFLVTF